MKISRQLWNDLFLKSITLALLGGGAAHAQTTVNWTATTPAGDSGNWSDTTRWTGGNVPDTSSEIANFGAYGTNAGGAGDGARTVTLDGSYSIHGLSISPRTTGFSGKSFTLATTSASNVLTIGAGGLSIGIGNTPVINAALALSTDQTWTTSADNVSNAAQFNGVISGTGKLTRTNQLTSNSSSVYTFSGSNTFQGGYVSSATSGAGLVVTQLGTSSVVAGGIIESGPLGTGTVTLNGGRLASNGATARTLHNNIVIGGTVHLGSSGTTGALTFSDIGLATASTFTLGSAIAGNISVLRAGGANLTFDQVIAESGGVGQGVNFASISGTPTVTLNRTKSATGNMLSGGVALVLANGSANSGALIAVNGSVTATGSNKFSSGALISDGAGLIATDATNYSAVSGGRASVFNNGRVSFATDQTQATVASLLSSDSQVRLGLGSGSGSAAVSQNYDQSALGDGKAGLVSASTGTITYNGSLTAGSDNTYRLGGGAGTLALGTALGGSGKSVRFEGGGTVTSNSDNTYGGVTTLNATTVTISGASGALSGTSGLAITSGSTLNLTNNTGAPNANRIADSATISLSNSTLNLNGTSTGGLAETMGNLTFDAGRSTITVATTPAANTVKSLQFGTLTRNNHALAIIRGDVLGSGTARNEIRLSSAPSLTGGGGAAGTTTISILPWARSLNASAGAPNTFVTYETNGFRPLNTSAEFVQASNTIRIDQAITNAGGGSTHNLRYVTPTNAGSTLLNTASSTVTVNSLILDATGASGGTYTHGLNSGTINIGSGALMIRQTPNQNMTVSGGTFAFGLAEGVVSVEANAAWLTTLSTNFTGSGGFSIYTQNASTVSLGGNNTFTGTFTLGGPGIIAVDQDARFGNAANSVVHAGGGLQFFANVNSSRNLTLLGNVGDNSLLNNTNGTVTWNGIISGAGRLRLANNASTASAAGFAIGGSNDFSGGTQIDGINVTGSNNNSFGTGTVTLAGANNNPASLSLTGTAPSLGGLRGTDGTVTLNPGASASTLTVGSNNDNTVFNGSITQGSGKTGSLTKTGTGTLVLGGNSTYTGTTTVDGGTLNLLGSTASAAIEVNSGRLLVNSSTSLGTSVTVKNNGTVGGSGTVYGSATIESGGTLSPGNSPGIMSFAALTLQTGSDFEFELIGNTTNDVGLNYDGVDILTGGILTIQSGVTSSLVFNSIGSTVNWADAFWSTNQSWRVFDTADNNFSNPLFANLAISIDSLGQSLNSVRSDASFAYSVSGGDIYLNYSAVPEPNFAALIGGFGALALLRRRR